MRYVNHCQNKKLPYKKKLKKKKKKKRKRIAIVWLKLKPHFYFNGWICKYDAKINKNGGGGTFVWI